jgi:septal ring factor EnvC (AmiA/AmiB activator)
MRTAQQAGNATSARATAAEREARSLRSRLTSTEEDIKQLRSQVASLEKQRTRDSNALRDAEARVTERDEKLDGLEKQLSKVCFLTDPAPFRLAQSSTPLARVLVVGLPTS